MFIFAEIWLYKMQLKLLDLEVGHLTFLSSSSKVNVQNFQKG